MFREWSRFSWLDLLALGNTEPHEKIKERAKSNKDLSKEPKKELDDVQCCSLLIEIITLVQCFSKCVLCQICHGGEPYPVRRTRLSTRRCSNCKEKFHIQELHKKSITLRIQMQAELQTKSFHCKAISYHKNMCCLPFTYTQLTTLVIAVHSRKITTFDSFLAEPL